MLQRVAILLLAVVVASSSVASCICSASACPMAEAQAAAATSGQADHGDHAAQATSGHGAHAGGSAQIADAPMAPMDCCAGSGPAGIASAVDCSGVQTEQPERLAEASSSFQPRTLGTAVHVAQPELTPPWAPPRCAPVVAVAAAPPETLIAQHTSLLR